MNYNYSYNAGGGAAGVFFTLVWLAFVVLTVVGLWKTLSKAGLPGWAAIIPFYNEYNIVKMSNRPVYFFWIMLACSLFAWIPLLDYPPDHRRLRPLGLHRPRHRRQLRTGHRLRDPAHHLPVDHVPDPGIRERDVQPYRRPRLRRLRRAADAGRRQLRRCSSAALRPPVRSPAAPPAPPAAPVTPAQTAAPAAPVTPVTPAADRAGRARDAAGDPSGDAG